MIQNSCFLGLFWSFLVFLSFDKLLKLLNKVARKSYWGSWGRWFKSSRPDQCCLGVTGFGLCPFFCGQIFKDITRPNSPKIFIKI